MVSQRISTQRAPEVHLWRVDSNLLHFDGYQGVNLPTATAHLAPQALHTAHPKPCGILDSLEYCAVSCMDLSMYSSGRSLGLQET